MSIPTVRGYTTSVVWIDELNHTHQFERQSLGWGLYVWACSCGELSDDQHAVPPPKGRKAKKGA